MAKMLVSVPFFLGGGGGRDGGGVGAGGEGVGAKLVAASLNP